MTPSRSAPPGAEEARQGDWAEVECYPKLQSPARRFEQRDGWIYVICEDGTAWRIEGEVAIRVDLLGSTDAPTQ